MVGYIEPLPAKEDGSPATGMEFANHIVGSAIPSGFIPSIEKGFREAVNTGAVIGYPMEVCRSKGFETRSEVYTLQFLPLSCGALSRLSSQCLLWVPRSKASRGS